MISLTCSKMLQHRFMGISNNMPKPFGAIHVVPGFKVETTSILTIKCSAIACKTKWPLYRHLVVKLFLCTDKKFRHLTSRATRLNSAGLDIYDYKYSKTMLLNLSLDVSTIWLLSRCLTMLQISNYHHQ